MLFNSWGFLLAFLPICFAGFWFLARISHLVAAGWLGMASLFFYAWWNPRFVILLLVSIGFNYLVGLRLARGEGRSRLLFASALGVNLTLLTWFKYANFFIDTLGTITGTSSVALDIVLPLGISFYTFTQIAFLVDAYRGIAREPNPVHYLLFVSYFPHLIAGPVLHHKQMMPQFLSSTTYQLNTTNLSQGLTILTIGLSKKVLLADNFAQMANPIFEAASGGVTLVPHVSWIGAVAYSLQLYFDFSGYSDMAVGLSLLFNVRLPLNFDSPYKAGSIIDFWRRWHMTLSAFLRDYLYFPLGGNRLGVTRRYANLMVTMLLGGLWHGANWTFVAWGGLHGLFLAINHGWHAVRRYRGWSPDSRITHALGVVLTFVCVVIAWVIFRADNFVTATHMLAPMLGFTEGTVPAELANQFSGQQLQSTIASLSGGLAIVWFLPNTQQFVGWADSSLRTIRWRWQGRHWEAILVGMLMGASLSSFGRISHFIYFQF
ncbi:MAG TPA: MBOAT family protein [Rhodocyclaceae bacterium]|nr:MBOAT family protein [Rhodocyclaceae bacterium]